MLLKSSQGFPIPDKYIDEIKETELGKVMDKIFSGKELGKGKGGISFLTKDEVEVSRIDLTKNAFIMALTKHINGDIVGFAFGYILLKPDGRKVFYLDAIDVIPEYQGKENGTGLITFARDYAKTSCCCKTYLITNKSNIPACKCYEKAGGISKADGDIVDVYKF